MRYLVLSDLHSNLEATRAVIRAAERLGYDRALVLGDLVGYAADPGPVIETVRALPGVLLVRGNHDKVVAGLDGTDGFNNQARDAAEWTRRALPTHVMTWLRGLPRGPIPFAPGALLSHGSPADEDAYLLDAGEARRAFDAAPFEICFFGHTHLPGVFALTGGRIDWAPVRGAAEEIPTAQGRRLLVNPGSVGQPRDRDARAAFAIYDDAARAVSVHRVAYPTEEACRKVRAAGLPAWLADRLTLGV